jgi:hypothetical protein
MQVLPLLEETHSVFWWWVTFNLLVAFAFAASNIYLLISVDHMHVLGALLHRIRSIGPDCYSSLAGTTDALAANDMPLGVQRFESFLICCPPPPPPVGVPMAAERDLLTL